MPLISGRYISRSGCAAPKRAAALSAAPEGPARQAVAQIGPSERVFSPGSWDLSMHKDWQEFIRQISPSIRDLRTGVPEVMKSFSGVGKAAGSDGALDRKTKELIALAIGVAVRCDDCIAFHARECAAAGASREEVLEMLGMAIYMGGGPSVMYGAHALEAFTQLAKPAQPATEQA